MVGAHRAREIRGEIFRRVDLWDGGPHAGLVGGVEAEGDALEVRTISVG